MAEYVLETKDLGISFGGLKAVENVDLKIKKKQLYGPYLCAYSYLPRYL